MITFIYPYVYLGLSIGGEICISILLDKCLLRGEMTFFKLLFGLTSF